MALENNTQVALAAFAVGIGFGAAARWSGFCLRGAVEDVLTKADAPRARGFLLAIAVALVSVQALVLTGRVDLSKAVILPTSLFWGGALLGGALFGIGMVLTGGCGTRMLVLAAGGNLRSVVVFIVFGFVAYATIRGLLAPARAALMSASSVSLAKQTLPLAVGGAVLVAALAFIVWRRVPAKHLIAGALIGLLVPAGYLVTAVLGGDEFEPATVESINVTRGGGDALIYLLTWTGSKINFGIAFVAGVFVGALLVVALQRDFKLVGFERPADMLRYAGGAALMGVGGVLALGCTVGNGLTGIASLAPNLVHCFARHGAGRGRDHEMALEETTMTATLKTITANGIHMRYAEAGSGPLVLFCHGWPESWYSWRHQLAAVSEGRLPRRCTGHARLRRHRGARADRPIHAVQPGRRHGRAGQGAGRDQGGPSSVTTGALRSPGMRRSGGPTCSPPSAA